MGADPVDLIRRVLSAHGEAWVPVEGDSMLPAIEPGRKVRIVAMPPEQIGAGQVVAVRIGAGLAVHRVAVRRGRTLLTLGDNLPLYDPAVDQDDVVGVVDLPVPPPPARRLPPAWPGSTGRTGDGRTGDGRTGDGRTGDGGADPGGAGHGGCQVQLWVFGGGTFRAPAGWIVHRWPRLGVGVSAATLAAVTRGTRAGVRVGVSPSGVLPVQALAAAGLPPVVHFLAGCPFGGGVAGAGLLLPPQLADVHVRPGEPGEPQDIAEVVERLSAIMARQVAA